MPLVLTRRDVESLLTMTDALEAVEEGFRRLALGQVLMPQRTAIRVKEHRGLHLGMPAYVGPCAAEDPTGGALGLKVVTVYPDNPTRGQLPTTIATLLLNDPRTGALLAIMDAGHLTAVRTGAASGVATKHLARPDAKTIGLFGAGAQARTQLQAVAAVRRIERVLVCDVAGGAAERFAATMSEQLSLRVEPTEDVQACAQADIVIAATSSKTPLFDGSLLRPGAHVNGVGAHAPDAREFDERALERCTVIADHAPACLAEAGELIIPINEGRLTADHIRASLGEVIAGLKPGRRSREEITFFKSCGLAVQDVATAARVYQLARAKGRGVDIQL